MDVDVDLISVWKKKSKKKAKKDKSKAAESNEVHGGLHVKESNMKEINEKFNGIMQEAGIDRKDHCLYSAIPGGACGSNTTALHCHRDQKLGSYVRRNINRYLVKFWPFFQPYFQFPLEVKVGFEKEPFNDEKGFLEFLQNDARSERMWMDHYGWQVVSNMYLISVHILTTGVSGMEEPKARYILS